MLDQFIETQLAYVDNLDELKVTLVALRLIEQRGGGMAWVTEDDLLAHPAVRDGLRMPAITLRPALLMAAARGTLVYASCGEVARYFRNDADGRRAAESFERSTGAAAPRYAENVPTARHADEESDAVLREVCTQLARLESIDFYPLSPEDPARIQEWTARGYTHAEVITAVRQALQHPRQRGEPHRTLADCEAMLYRTAPQKPTEYFDICVSRAREMPDEIRNLHMRIRRMPTFAEYTAVREAVALFGLRAVLGMLGSMARSGGIDVRKLIPLLSESEDAALAMARVPSADEAKVREVARLLETTVGLPANSTILDDMRAVLHDVPEIATWRAVLEHCARNEKKSWPYIRKLLLNPSPTLFTPPPVNAVATAAFDMYRRRINRQIDPVVATEINALVVQVTDPAHWKAAFDAAAAANALRWDYIRAVLTTNRDGNTPVRTATRRASPERSQTTRRSSSFRRAPAEFSPEERQAAEERARRALEEEDDE